MHASRLVTVLVTTIAAGLGLAVPFAHASRTQRSFFEDDRQLLWSGAAARDQALDEIKALGADTIHVLVVWNRLAPSPDALKRPAVDPADPSAYSGWDAYDGVVTGALARGLRVLLTPTGRGPAWASQCKGPVSRRQICLPRPAEYANFVRALGKRYSGAYTTGGQTLPKVDEWSFWNEPNHSSWLIPQTARRHGVRFNAAAKRYRELVQAAIRALATTGHAGDTMLIGETAPLGSQHSTAPVDFYRELFCIDSAGRAFRGNAARVRGCAQLPRFKVTGVAHHPYTFDASAAPSITGRAGDVPIGALGRLTKVLDRAARLRVIPRRTPVFLTEFGYQTRPPDPFGVSLSEQARYINYADYIAFNNPRVASVAQYGLRDDRSNAGFNTGLRFTSGRAKPALAAYALPVWVTRAGRSGGRIFGQARGAGPAVLVQLQNRTSKRGAFVTIGEVQTNAAGYFLQRVPRVAGEWRLRYKSTAADSPVRYSRVATAR